MLLFAFFYYVKLHWRDGVLVQNPLLSLSTARASGKHAGIYSICSAHPWVIEAAIRQATKDGGFLLIEATSNQVNHTGGYTGMTPSEFRALVFDQADRLGFERSRLLLGGDHLGPNPWKHLDASAAMEHAKETVRQYVQAGFCKIHLDTSMACSDDAANLSDEVIAARAANLCLIAEQAGGVPAPLYVIGTEVPPPGGAQHELHTVEVTSPEAAQRAIEVHRKAFLAAGLESAWSRVIALVVQPGLEFGDLNVIDYASEKTRSLRGILQNYPGLVFEAHSTDYQKQQAYVDLVKDGFAILKVGPALTFAMRETLAALEDIERQTIPAERRSQLSGAVDSTMLQSPRYWISHYHGSEQTQKLLRTYSYSDRIRYYWNETRVKDAIARLLVNLRTKEIPEVVLSRYLPIQYAAIRSGELSSDPEQLVIHSIQQVIQHYSRACMSTCMSERS